MVKEICRSWAEFTQNRGQNSVAARCWLSAGEPLRCAAVLARRPDLAALRLAATIYKKEGEAERARLLVLQVAGHAQAGAGELEALVKEFPEIEGEIKKYGTGDEKEKNGKEEKKEGTEE